MTMPQVRRVSADAVIDLRHIVLRDGLPRREAIFPGDDSPSARHYGAFEDDRLIGCVTLHLNKWETQPAWQLRGMAVASDVRSSGIGRAMIEMLERDLDDSPVRQLWCNARVPASGFYVKLGWKIVSEQFEIPTAGPHVRMARRLGPIPSR
jgi:predicted GNAT family N-acyltransferase